MYTQVPLVHTRTHVTLPSHTCTLLVSHSGGVVLTFFGTNLDVIQNPMLVVTDPQYLNEANVSAMTVLSIIMTIFL